MLFFSLIFVVLFLILLSKIFLKCYFNPISIYLAVWTIGILLCVIDITDSFNSIDETNLLFIFFTMLTFFLGGVFAILVLKESIHSSSTLDFTRYSKSMIAMKKYIISFTIISLFSSSINWLFLLNEYGSLKNVILNANLTYSLRVTGEAKTQIIPYLDSFGLAACALTGVYFSYIRKFNVWFLYPLVIVIMNSFVSMSRFGILFSIFLYLNPIFLNFKLKLDKKNIIRLFLIVFVSITVFVGTTQIRIIRSGNIQSINNQQIAEYLGPFGEAAISSLFDYLGGPIITLVSSFEYDPRYLRNDELPGSQTVSPVYRILQKVSGSESSSYYETFVNIGSIEMNVGTYLKDVYSDFGYFGVVVAPIILGIVSVFFFIRWRFSGRFIYFILLIFSLLYIEFSSIVNLLRLGYFLICLIACIIAAIHCERIQNRYTAVFTNRTSQNALRR